LFSVTLIITENTPRIS